MLAKTDSIATIAVKDIETARQFYEQILELKLVGEQQMGTARYTTGSGSLFVYESSFAGTNQATAVTWIVGKAIEAHVSNLKAKGMVFERYDLPSTRHEGALHIFERLKLAWFKDPDGNIHALVGE